MAYEIKSPTHGLVAGTAITVRGSLLAHHVDGQPYVAFRSIGGASSTPVWVNPDDIVDAPAPAPEVPSRRRRALRWVTDRRYSVVDLGWMIPSAPMFADGRLGWALGISIVGIFVAGLVRTFAERHP